MRTSAKTGVRKGSKTGSRRVRLVQPEPGPTVALARALADRRSCREFGDRPLSPRQISLLCWSAQGITDAREQLRASPSAGGVFPMKLLVADEDGVWSYEPEEHALEQELESDCRAALQEHAFNQSCVGQAPVCFIIAANIGRTARKYGADAERYCLLEAGHIAQNILLQATALGLGAVPVGAFDEAGAAGALELPGRQRPLYLVAVGHPAST